jgi:hypothetical protein
MMGRLVGALGTLIVYFCSATLIAQLVMIAYLWSTWKMDQDKVVRILAIARGLEPAVPEPKEEEKKEPVVSEQASYEELLERRAVKLRDLELREQALASALDEMKFQQQQLADSRQKEQQRIDRFTTELKTLKSGAEATGRELVRRTLETVKPKQAKEQLFQMLQNNETDEVVMLLADMPENRRAKILAEFKTPEENKKLAEVLRRLREGQPEATLVDKTQQTPVPTKPAGS